MRQRVRTNVPKQTHSIFKFPSFYQSIWTTTWRYLAKFETLWRCWTTIDIRRVIKIAKPVFSASEVIFAGIKPIITVLGTDGNPFQSSFFDMPFDKVGFTLPKTFLVFYVPLTCLQEKTNVTIISSVSHGAKIQSIQCSQCPCQSSDSR